VVGSRTRQPLFLCLKSDPMLDILFDWALEFSRAIRRYRRDLGMYADDYFGARGWREKFLKNKIS
jgi:hypothetical protein